MNKREEQIHDYTVTLNKYKNNTNELDPSFCVKCIRVNNKCQYCPENCHDTQYAIAHCLNRNTKAVASKDANIFGKHIQAVIDYHIRAIKFLNNMKRFNMVSFKNELLRLDKLYKP